MHALTEKSIKEGKCAFSIFMVIFMTSSFTVLMDVIPSELTIVLWFMLLIFFLVSTRKIDTKVISILGLLLMIMLLSCLFNGEEITTLIKTFFIFIVVFLYVNCYSYLMIKSSLVKVVLFISIVSIPFFFVSITHPAFFDLFLVKPSNNWRTYYNFYIFNHITHADRNCGMFWEPGAFSTFINLALLIIALDKNNFSSKRTLKMGILAFTNVLTFSTTGYICMALVFVIYLMANQTSKREKIVFAILVGVMLLIVFRVYYDELFGIGQNNTFGKISQYFDNRSNLSLTGGTVGIRISSIIKPFEEFLSNPLLGVGYDNLKERTMAYTNGSITCTFVNWFAIYGIGYGLIMTIGYIKAIKRINQKTVIKILVFLLFCLLIIAEDYSQNGFFVGAALLGYKSIKLSKQNELEGAALNA